MPITVTTWNVQNLAKSDLAFADKLDFLVGTLQALASDVVALQEILDLNALQDLATRLGFQPVAATPDGRGNRVAFLTRNVLARPPQQIDQWQLAQGVNVRDFQRNGAIGILPRFPRPAFQITVAHDGGEHRHRHRTPEIQAAHLRNELLDDERDAASADRLLRPRAPGG